MFHVNECMLCSCIQEVSTQYSILIWWMKRVLVSSPTWTMISWGQGVFCLPFPQLNSLYPLKIVISHTKFLSPLGFHIWYSLCQKHYSPSLHVDYFYELLFRANFHDSPRPVLEALWLYTHSTCSLFSHRTYHSTVIACFLSPQ